MAEIVQILFSISILLVVDAARILVVAPTPSISHQVAFRPLAHELSKRHQVTIITTDPVFIKGEAPENITEVDLHEISYKEWRETILSSKTTSGKTNDMIPQKKKMCSVMSSVFEKQMRHPEVKEIITNKTFDLLILEAWVKPCYIFTHIFKVPTILLSSFGGFNYNFDTLGAPCRPPLLYPNQHHQRIGNLTLWEKISELYLHYKMEYFYHSHEMSDDKMIKRILGPDTPSIKELQKNVDVIFLNQHPMWDMNRPVPPSLVYIGGIHQNPVKKLPKDQKGTHPKGQDQLLSSLHY